MQRVNYYGGDRYEYLGSEPYPVEGETPEWFDAPALARLCVVHTPVLGSQVDPETGEIVEVLLLGPDAKVIPNPRTWMASPGCPSIPTEELVKAAKELVAKWESGEIKGAAELLRLAKEASVPVRAVEAVEYGTDELGPCAPDKYPDPNGVRVTKDGSLMLFFL